jgi:DNA-binding response OmpR family regulator
MVLVVDDEDAVREVAAALLRRMGLRVLTARGGTEGVEVFRTHSSEIDCALVDLSMPDLDGMRTREAMLRIRPDASVLLMSGHPAEAGEDLPFAAHLVLHKPFGREELDARLSALFGAQAAAGAQRLSPP